MAAVKWRRLPSRYAGIVMPLILSILMSGIVSCVATLTSLGMTPDFVGLWLNAWLASWLIAFPTLLIVLPIVRRLVALVVEPPLH